MGKKALVVVVILLITLNGVSCVSKTDKLIAYMNEKYDDNFTYAAPFGGGAGASSLQVNVRSEKLQNDEIWVEYYEKDGEEIFADDYIARKYEAQTKEFLYETLKSALGCEVIVSYGVGTKGSRNPFTNDTSFADYIATEASYIGFLATVSPTYKLSDREETKQKIEAAFAKNGFVADGDIYFAEEEAQFADAAYVLPMKVLDAMPRLIFEMNETQAFSSYKWR
jgi:hypothetical protein